MVSFNVIIEKSLKRMAIPSLIVLSFNSHFMDSPSVKRAITSPRFNRISWFCPYTKATEDIVNTIIKANRNLTKVTGA
jgi:hypothetical protein